MQELIKVTTNEQGLRVVSARDLYEYLQIKSKFADWIKNRITKYGFVENQDFVLVSKILETNNPKNPTSEGFDYALTLDTAKELAMVEGNDRGKQARQYFIECERALKQTIQPQTAAVALPSVKELALMVLRAEEEKEKLLVENAKLAPKAEFTDKVLQSVDTYPISVIAKELGMSASELNKKLCERGIQYKAFGTYILYAKYQAKGFTKARTHAYLDSEGIPRTNTYTVWTEYGRVFIHSLFNSNLSFNKNYSHN